MAVFAEFKGRLRATIFESAETVHLIMLCYFGDAIRWTVSAEKKMSVHNRPFIYILSIICNLFHQVKEKGSSEFVSKKNNLDDPSNLEIKDSENKFALFSICKILKIFLQFLRKPFSHGNFQVCIACSILKVFIRMTRNTFKLQTRIQN